MSDMTYQTDEYVSALEIETFLNCLQLEFMVKEHRAVREVIRSILVKNLPVPNRAIKVTAIGEMSAPCFSLPKPKEFGFYIQYQTQQVSVSEDSQTAPTWVGDHLICGFYNNEIREFVISVRFNKLNMDAIAEAWSSKRMAAKTEAELNWEAGDRFCIGQYNCSDGRNRFAAERAGCRLVLDKLLCRVCVNERI